MLIANVSNYLKAVIESMGHTFMRATDIEANIEVDQVDLSAGTGIIFILNNLPTVTHLISMSGAGKSTWPCELQVLKLADLDDKETQSDDIRGQCQDACYQVIARFDPEIYAAYPTPYSINFLGQTKIYDKTLTGCSLSMELLYDIPIYGCGTIRIRNVRLLEFAMGVTTTGNRKVRLLESSMGLLI